MEPQDAKMARLKRKHDLLNRGCSEKRKNKGIVCYILHIIN